MEKAIDVVVGMSMTINCLHKIAKTLVVIIACLLLFPSNVVSQSFGPLDYFFQKALMRESGITYVGRESSNRLILKAHHIAEPLDMQFDNDTARFEYQGRKYLFFYSKYQVRFQRDDTVLVHDSTWNLPSNLFMNDTLDKRLFYYGAHAFVFRNLSRLTIRVSVDSNALATDDLIINCMCPDKRNRIIEDYFRKKYKPKFGSWAGGGSYFIYGSGFKEAFMQYKLINPSGTMTLEEILANE